MSNLTKLISVFFLLVILCFISAAKSAKDVSRLIDELQSEDNRVIVSAVIDLTKRGQVHS